MFALRLGSNRLPLGRMGFELFFGFLGVPEHDQKTSFVLDWLRALSGGLGTEFDTPGDSKNRSGRVTLRIFGVFFWRPVFKPFCHCFLFFVYSADLEFVSLFTVL